MITGHTNFLQSLGWAVFNSLWQMALLWIVYQAIIAFARPLRSSFKNSLAVTLLLSGFAWFIYTFAAAYFTSTDPGNIRAFSSLLNQDSTETNWLRPVLSSASIAYLVLLLLPVLRFIKNYRYVQVIRNYGLEKMDAQWRLFVQQVAERMDIRKKVQLWASEFVSSPVTVGFLKPVILVPLAAINHLTTRQLEAVLLHELAHIRRFDYITNLLINFIRTILYFNPFVKAFVKIVEREREKSCDEMVLQFQYDSYEYASALLTLEKASHNEKIFVLAASGKKNDLLQRVELIMGVKQKPVFSINKLAGLIAGLFCIISLNALFMQNRTANGYKAGSFNYLSPALSYVNDAKEDRNKMQRNEPSVAAFKTPAEPTNPVSIVAGIGHPDFIPASFDVNEIPQLKKYQEEQVKQALEKSKKIFENEEWKALERNIAEVLTQQEKEELKETYQKELSKLDWNKWENKLRQSYEKVNWAQVNEQLAKAVNNIRIDSLQKVYNEAICKLEQANEELRGTNLSGAAGPGITAKVLDETKQQLNKTLNSLKASRNKKIVHL